MKASGGTIRVEVFKGAMAEHTAELMVRVVLRFTYRDNVWRCGHVTEQFKLTDVLEEVQHASK